MKMEIVSECVVGFFEIQKEKFVFFVEGVEFEIEEGFRNKVEIIKELYFICKVVE